MLRVLAVVALAQAFGRVQAQGSDPRDGCLNPFFRLEDFAEGGGCGSGNAQSPINFDVPTKPLGRACAKIKQPTILDAVVQNKGTALQVSCS